MIAISCVQGIILILGCVYGAITDLRIGKIKNWLSCAMIMVGMAIFIVKVCMIEQYEINYYLVNVGLISVMSIILYASHIWAGGDCKLMIAVSVLYPDEYYWNIDNKNISLTIMLAMIFIIGFLYLFLETIFLMKKEKIQVTNMKEEIENNIFGYIRTIIFLSALNQIYYFIFAPKIEIPTIIYYCLCIIYSVKLQKIEIMKEKIVIIIFLVFDILMYLFTENRTISISWKTYVVVTCFIFIRYFMNLYNYKTIRVEELREGMILSRASSIWMQKSKVKGLPAISDESLKCRLKSSEIESIRRWKKSKYGLENIVVVRKIPFAIFITIGLGLYLVIGVI